MTSKIYSAITQGYQAKLVEVECDTSNGLPSLLIVGLGGKAIDEARERVRSAIKNSGLTFPRKRITINLAPANLPKSGTHFDLPIALSLLRISGQLHAELDKLLIVGELGLDGAIRSIRGVINYVQAAIEHNIHTVVVPAANFQQASLLQGITIIPVSSIRELLAHLHKEATISPPKKIITPYKKPTTLQLIHIQGQEQAKRGLIIAAAGHHNILFNGPPGAGKTMLAKSALSLLPPPSTQEVIEITKLHSLAGETEELIITQRPFRSPHHSASHVAIVGGGQHSKPGEISLAHQGILFLDELPEYNRQTLEALRQPLEDKIIHISRAETRATYPANCMVIATQNPCPCGYAGDPIKSCICSNNQILQYQKRISGPLLDRIDLFISLSKVSHDQLLNKTTKPPVDYQKTIQAARERQYNRYNNQTNAAVDNESLRAKINLSPTGQAQLNTAAKHLELTARSYFKTLRVSRTIADLENNDTILEAHVIEALQYRYRKPPSS